MIAPPPFWADNFDMDLPQLLPDFNDLLGATADTTLWTHAGETHGRLNHPAVWNEPAGPTAFFGLTANGTGQPGEYISGKPVVECTWREAVRDAWPHMYLLVVQGVLVWDTWRLRDVFTDLMYDLRGQRRLPAGRADQLLDSVRAGVRAATLRVQRLASTAGADR